VTTGGLPRDLLERLLDDAAVFPPGNAPLREAMEGHRGWRTGAHADLVGRFLLPADRAAQFREIAAGLPPLRWEVGLVARGDSLAASAAAAAEAARALRGDGVRVTAVELALPPAAGEGELAALEPLGEAPPDAALFLELPRGVDALDLVLAARAIVGMPVGAKLRCGGVAADAFPSVAEVAGWIAGCVERDLPFKATAGLHQPLRHADAVLGVVQHGFLNLWAATAAARRGAGAADLIPCLDATAADALGVGADELRAARSSFTGFGTCSIQEPLDGLAALGWLPIPAHA
jgi:hypothetical protein